MQSRSLSIALNNFCFAFLTLVWTPIKSRLLHTQSLHALAWIRWTYCEHQPTHTFKNIVTKNYCYTPTHRHTHALLINLPVKFIYQLCSLYVSRSSAGRESRTKIRWVAVLKTATPSRLHINSPGGFIQRLRCLFLGLGPSVGPAPYQFMKCDYSEASWQQSFCLKMQVSGSWTRPSSGTHPPPSLWILISTIIWHMTHTHTEETRECVQPLRPSAKLSRGGRGGMSKRSGAAGRGVQATLGEVCEKMRIGSYCHTPKHKLHGEPRPENEFLLSGCSRMKFISSCCS